MVFQVSRGSWMMVAPGCRASRACGQQAHQVVALDEVSLFIEEEAAVEVAVPGQAEVGAMVAHRFGGGLPVLRQQRVGDAMGKSGVRLVVHLDEPEGQMLLQPVEHRAGAAVAGIDHHLQGLAGGEIDIAQQVGDVGLEGVGG